MRWSSLSWEEVDRWAGSRSVSRGRAYHRRGRVRDLMLAEDGRLLATVLGGNRYVTSVGLAPGDEGRRRIQSTCTCPVGFDGCKHAVAVVIAFLEAVAGQKNVPAARPDDPRWAKLTNQAANLDDEFGEELTDESDDDAPEDVDGLDVESGPRRTDPVSKPATDAAPQSGKRRTRTEWDARIRAHLGERSHEELVELVWSLVARFPELREEFQERIALAEGDAGRLLNQARRTLHAVTAEAGWRNHWSGEGHTPDYTRLKQKLERLVEGGHFDHVLELGSDLIRRGMRQIEESHDEGETVMAISDCLPVVFDALARSNRPAPDKILYAIDAHLRDEYDVIGPAAGTILDARWQLADWSAVADRLADRLKNTPRGKNADDFTRNYRRDRVSAWLLQALERAGRNDELLALYETEARVTGSYQRLVEYLLREGRFDDAERWTREGIEKTARKWPGIADALRKCLCELARRRRKWDIVAAHAAHALFERPSVQGFQELTAAAGKARCAERVRAAALQFLESGVSPIRIGHGGKGETHVTVDPAWPLPVPDYLAPATRIGATGRSASRPHYAVLLEMAMAERRSDDVLRWYDQMGALEKRSPQGGGGWGAYGHASYSDQVAVAVAATHPERALDIYRRGLEAHLKLANVSAYENCAIYLRKMRPILKSLGRAEEWTRLLAEIRQGYRNRPRFMEILDTLEGRTILQTQKSCHGR